MRQVNVGHGDRAEVDDLAQPVEHCAGLEWQDLGGGREGYGAPEREAVDPPRQQVSLVLTTDVFRQIVHLPRRLLHQQKIGVLAPDQADDVTKRRPGEAEQIPAD